MESSISVELEEIVSRDQAFRTGMSQEMVVEARSVPGCAEEIARKMSESDAQNRVAVQQMIDGNMLCLPEQFKDASIIFIHGETVGDYLQSFNLSLTAIELGMHPADTLLAQAFDRYTIQKQKDAGIADIDIKQRFGTQAILEDGEKRVYLVDDEDTEEEKKIFAPTIQGFSELSAKEQDDLVDKSRRIWENLTKEEKDKLLANLKYRISSDL
jgi:hypothetical protein